ncbi:MAG: phenylacetate--CoA ligase family protein [Candidatus Marinimicrobia bacterium]|nr:phenylacetate--CoA ligase family protein [Candidatus Neomarinimicrobiota bacterium]
MKRQYKELQTAPLEHLLDLQNTRFLEFINYVTNHSEFYKNYYADIDLSQIKDVTGISLLPVMEKETLRRNIKTIKTISPNKSYVGHTGGTTGKSLEVYYRWDDIQDRFAMLDAFREKYGYKFGKRTAWFSGKTILNKKDERKKRFWKLDYFFNIRYYSTFHITQENIPYILEDLNWYQPKIISGFPSNLFEIANTARLNDLRVTFKPDIIFTTAETLIKEQIDVIEEVFNCKVFDQYASSEGAPFLFQCQKGRMHFQLLSGIIEIVDENMKPAQEGEILVSSFTTRGTPLVRYRIGDKMSWSNEICDCGDTQPVIKSVQGREIEYIYSRERGKINLGNISNCVKNLNGVVKFQIIQDKLDEIDVKIITDQSHYSGEDENEFKKELVDRLGELIKINFHYVQDIEKSASGKYSIVKNNIHHLVK